MGDEPRIAPLAADDARAAADVAGLPSVMADLNVFRVWLRHPELARWLNDLLMGLLWRSALDVRLRELVIMRLGWVTGSEYEWTQHWRIAAHLGVAEDDLLAVRDWERYERFGPAERAVLAATDETVATGAVSDETWAACVEHVSEDERVLLELVAAIGCWHMVAGILRTLRVPLEDGTGSWPPDGRAPAGGVD